MIDVAARRKFIQSANALVGASAISETVVQQLCDDLSNLLGQECGVSVKVSVAVGQFGQTLEQLEAELDAESAQ